MGATENNSVRPVQPSFKNRCACEQEVESSVTSKASPLMNFPIVQNFNPTVSPLATPRNSEWREQRKSCGQVPSKTYSMFSS